ncbi:hypothetical protein PDJAM_G00179750, partial [Pangasius djambal]|nr:hypothetical protein [Pangasius djambal]
MTADRICLPPELGWFTLNSGVQNENVQNIQPGGRGARLCSFDSYTGSDHRDWASDKDKYKIYK